MIWLHGIDLFYWVKGLRHHLASLCVFLRAENQNTPPCCIQQGNICLLLKHWSALLFSSSSSYLPLVEWRTNPSLGCKYVYIIKFLRFLTKFLKIKFLIYHWKEKPSFWQEPQCRFFSPFKIFPEHCVLKFAVDCKRLSICLIINKSWRWTLIVK